MKSIYKGLFIFYLIIELARQNTVTNYEVLLILSIIFIVILRERYNYSIHYTTIIIFILVTIGMYWNNKFVLLYAIVLFDCIHHKVYICIIPVVFSCFYFIGTEENIIYILLILTVNSFFAHISRREQDKDQYYKRFLDEERRLRYELEQAKNLLINSNDEIARIAGIKERNRIAREIHDNIGHTMTGILMQLQVVNKFYGKDNKKAKEAIQKSISSLSQSLTIIRDTVHNIKPKENLGVEYIHSIIDNYNFCPVKFRYRGDFNTIPVRHMEIISANIKEALTNTAKYSEATSIDIEININEKFIRLYIKDNGKGCININEGLGLSSMRERIKNIGGNISISGDKGFMIVSIIPIYEEEGGKVFEGINS